ncbi:hypothetical protein [Amycolatopsis sp. WQ 127309]|uniref:hypothetical protein n=1 Tax=Amycolatopsis sp. WQ 127309 TaxID=2932773 RepID=UPI001FF0F595|nr:hypothetical protein [Amycolatopsis sp. WQ 127309]UOZ10545.1 hypothetical protein MUY22_20680 [Amycolatopsis sp. WQ 127309]
MSKESGLGDRLYVGGYDLSGDIGALDSIASPRGVLDVTGINKSAMERIYGTRDGNMQFTAFFNVDPGQAHPVLSALPTSDVELIYGHGATLGNVAAAMVGKQIGYDPSRGADGSLTFKVEVQANGYGLEWCKQVTAGVRTDSAAATGTGVDFGTTAVTGTSAFGLQAYLEVTALTGTNVVIKLQESDSAGSGFADVTGGAFTSVTSAPASQRIQTARGQSVKRYLRVVTSGTFSSASFVVVVARNQTSVVF